MVMKKILMELIDKLKLDQKMSNKKGFGGAKIAMLIGVLIFLVMLGGIGATMFSNLTIAGAPSFWSLTAPIVVAGGLIMAIWKMFY